MNIPASLRRWFVVHAIVDYLAGIPLLLFPEQVLGLVGWPTIDVLAARLVGAALLGIGGVSFIARAAGRESYRNLLALKILWSGAAMIGILLSMRAGYPAAGWAVLALFAIFASAWWYYYVRLR
jgi:hypothetical protein